MEQKVASAPIVRIKSPKFTQVNYVNKTSFFFLILPQGNLKKIAVLDQNNVHPSTLDN